jgi:hypothetical protein
MDGKYWRAEINGSFSRKVHCSVERGILSVRIQFNRRWTQMITALRMGFLAREAAHVWG